MKVFIDFDDVIFNTKKFKEDLCQLFIDTGVPKSIFDFCYYDPNDLRTIKTFDPQLQLARIKTKVDFDTNELEKQVNNFLSNLSGYVFDDVMRFLTAVGSENCLILSFGEKHFLRLKITNSKITEHVSNLILTEGKKSVELENYFSKVNIKSTEQIFFIDDRVEQIEDVKTHFPAIITLHMQRPGGRYSERGTTKYADYTVSNLTEATKIILNL